MDAVYAFTNAVGQLQKVEASSLNFTGSWSTSGTYFAVTLDTVNYSNGQFTCIVNNTNQNPVIGTSFWSPLVLLIPGAPVFGLGQIITTGDANPNLAQIVPTDATSGAFFYQDPAVGANEWKWSTGSQTWIQANTIFAFDGNPNGTLTCSGPGEVIGSGSSVGDLWFKTTGTISKTDWFQVLG